MITEYQKSVKEQLIQTTFEKIVKIKRFKNYSKEDVARVINLLDSRIYEEMIEGRGVMIRGKLSIYPDPGSKALLSGRKERKRVAILSRKKLH